MKLYIVGEDLVTNAIIKRVLSYCSSIDSSVDSSEIEIISELPARGGQIKNRIQNFNALALSSPVILLTDLDNEACAPLLLNKLLQNGKNEHFIFNIAVDEAEAWLMADREGFSSYFSIDLNCMPIAVKQKQGGRVPRIEMDFKYKSSMFLTHELILKCGNKEIRKQLTPKPGAAKGPEYNSALLPFIENGWDISRARENSDSLERMIGRIEKLMQLWTI